MSIASFPALRMRRTRSSAWSRALVAETSLTPSDLIWPLFVTEGQGLEEPIGTLPGVSRWSVDRIGAQARIARDLGIPCIALFPNTPSNLRTEDAREALNAENLICRAVKAAKDAAPEIWSCHHSCIAPAGGIKSSHASRLLRTRLSPRCPATAAEKKSRETVSPVHASPPKSDCRCPLAASSRRD